jgi:hypothetical protein
LAYALGGQIDATQMAALKRKTEPGHSREELPAFLNAELTRPKPSIRCIDHSVKSKGSRILPNCERAISVNACLGAQLKSRVRCCGRRWLKSNRN